MRNRRKRRSIYEPSMQFNDGVLVSCVPTPRCYLQNHGRVYKTRETRLSKQTSSSWKFQKKSGRSTQPLFNDTVTGDLSGRQRDVDIDSEVQVTANQTQLKQTYTENVTELRQRNNYLKKKKKKLKIQPKKILICIKSNTEHEMYSNRASVDIRKV